MSADAHSPQPADNGVSRREAMKRVGLAAGTLTAAGAAGDRLAPRYSPIGRAQAIAPAGVLIGAALIAGTHYAVDQWYQPDTDLDPEDVLEDQLYHAASSVAQGRETFVDEMEHEFLEADVTPHERVAWQEIRASAVKEIVNGNGESAALSAAQEALDKQTTRSIVNSYERWNSGINALVEQMTIDVDEEVGVYYGPTSSNDDIVALEDGVDVEDEEIEPVEASEVGTEMYVVWSVPVDTPIDPSDLEGRDEGLTALGFGVSGENVNAPLIPEWGGSDLATTIQERPLMARHDDLDHVTAIDAGVFFDVFEVIENTYTDISNDLSTYVSNLHDGIQQGAIDPDDILSSNDIIELFADSDEQSRLAAELLAMGANVPESAGYQAEISHPDLQAESLWGMIFPQWTDTGVPITPGTTISSADYEMAYFGYESAVDDDGWESIVLSGEEDLEVLDVDGVDGQEVLDQPYDDAGENGDVVIYEGDDPPDPVADPTAEKYEGWVVVIDGETNQHIADITDIVEDGDQFLIENTDLDHQETIDYVEIVPSIEHSRSVDHVADPTDPDSEETIERLENLRDQVEDLEEALDDDGGGGGIGDWWDGGSGGFAGAAIGAIAVLLAIVGIGQVAS